MYHDYNMEKILDHIRTCPKKKFILDTDTFNEIDDQFAITYAMLSEDIDLLALTAAPFLNSRASSVEDGMEKSYEDFILPVFVMNAILRSYESGKKEEINKIEL